MTPPTDRHAAPDSVTSSLWGANGELWDPAGRLPDFSWAGYHGCAEEPPVLPRGTSVRDFGAVGDGQHDDTAAFEQALATVNGVIEIPAGRYVITRILEINRPGVVLRGSGPDSAVLVCPIPLSDIQPDWGATTEGKRTSNYSWAGGMVWIVGRPQVRDRLAAIVAPAARGDCFLQADSTTNLQPGQRVLVHQQDNADNTLARHLYSDDPGETHELKGSTTSRLICRIVSIDGDRVEIDRPLRCDIRAEWTPEMLPFAPSVTECGIEHLGFEFPDQPYPGHFNELGHNAIAIQNAADCWVRDIRIHNADGGIFMKSAFCSVLDVRFTCSRAPDADGCTGHHGVYFAGDDNLYSRFDYQTRFIHDISVSLSAGNVFSDGRGVDLAFDHHKRTPYENLFTNVDTGRSTRPWHCGGGAALGKHCAARGTFWNLQSDQPPTYPPERFGPASMNLVGIRSDDTPETATDGQWLECVAGPMVTPANLHLAQLRRRTQVR